MTNVFKWDKMSCHAPYMVMMTPLKNFNTTISLPLNKKKDNLLGRKSLWLIQRVILGSMDTNAYKIDAYVVVRSTLTS